MWDRAIYYPLRAELFFDRFADVGVTDAAPDKGATVTFTKFNDLAAVTTPISETTDIDAVAMSDAQVSLTLAEYGSGVNTSFRVRATSFINLNQPVANIVGYNAGISLDTLARDVIQAIGTPRYAGAAVSRVTVAAGHVLTAANIRRAFVALQEANVATFNGYYICMIHPKVAYDLRGETGTAGWRDPHVYSAPNEIWRGEMGEFEGFRFIVSPRAPVFADAGVGGTVDVYRTLFFGRQAIAKAYSTWEGRGAYPIVIMGPVVDKLKRLQPISWHWFGVYGAFRTESITSYESSSSIGANT
jgi:N4-gp56 family major capsid protein